MLGKNCPHFGNDRMAKKNPAAGKEGGEHTVGKDKVVSVHFILRGEDEEVLDSSEGQDPLVYLHGHGQIIPGLEDALVGKVIGDALSVEVLMPQVFLEILWEKTPDGWCHRCRASLVSSSHFGWEVISVALRQWRALRCIGKGARVFLDHRAGSKLQHAAKTPGCLHTGGQ